MSTLYKHQINAVQRAIAQGGNIALFHEPGLGKTRTALTIFKELGVRNLLVICPLTLINSAWGEECEYQGLTFKSLKDFEKELGGKTLPVVPDVLAINFESFILKRHLEVIRGLCISKDFACAVDESSRLKNPKSITTKKCLELASFFKYRIIMSGTPSPNTMMELWGQVKFVSRGTLHDSFYAFRNTYFHLQRGTQIVRGSTMNAYALREMFSKGWKYAISEKSRDMLIKQTSGVCDWVKKESAVDLPEQIDIVRHVYLSPKELKHYKEMEKHLITEIQGRAVVAQIALTKLMKLRQVTSGFMYNEEKAIEIGNSKLKALEELLEKLGTRQVIIWVQFNAEVHAIQAMLKGSHTILTGSTVNKDAAINDFKSREVQYLIAHPRSAGHGLNFVNCDTTVFYSIDYSNEAHTQAKDRVHRIGQTNKCVYYYLFAKDTIDEEIYAVITGKKKVQDILFERGL